MATSRRTTRARSRLTDGEDVVAPGTDPGSPVSAPASPRIPRTPPPSTPHFSTQDGRPRADTPRPPAKAQGEIYRDGNGVFRTASAAKARALDMPPPPPRPRHPGARHGIAAGDGRREGTRVPKLADENVARILDVMRYWAAVNDSASTSARLPWAEAFNFIETRGAFVEPNRRILQRVDEFSHRRRALQTATSSLYFFLRACVVRLSNKHGTIEWWTNDAVVSIDQKFGHGLVFVLDPSSELEVQAC